MTEKRAVILDIGSRFTKIGLAQGFSPYAIIPSSIFVPPLNAVVYLDDLGTYLVQGLKSFIQKIYFRFLGFNTKERKVVICESLLVKPEFRKVLIEILIEFFEIPGLLLVPHHYMALIPMAISTGLVVDCGYKETVILPIVEGQILLNKITFINLAGKALNQRIRKELISRKTTIIDNSTSKKYTDDELSESIIENIKVKACFVAPFERGMLMSSLKSKDPDYFSNDNNIDGPKDFRFHVDSSKFLIIPGALRESVAEIFFELTGELNVATAILETIMHCPIDARKVLSSNLVVIGGTSMLPGFLHRLKMELTNLIQKEEPYKTKLNSMKFAFHKNLCKANYASWLGASIFASNEALYTRIITKDHYLNDKQKAFLDWNEFISV